MYHFRHLGSQLAEIKIAIERMMESDFVTFLMEGLKQRLGSQERSSDQDEQTTEVCVLFVCVCMPVDGCQSTEINIILPVLLQIFKIIFGLFV